MAKTNIKGGDKVRLKDGRVVAVADIRNKFIVVSCSEWVAMSEVVEIVERLN